MVLVVAACAQFMSVCDSLQEACNILFISLKYILIFFFSFSLILYYCMEGPEFLKCLFLFADKMGWKILKTEKGKKMILILCPCFSFSFYNYFLIHLTFH